MRHVCGLEVGEGVVGLDKFSGRCYHLPQDMNRGTGNDGNDSSSMLC